LDTPGLSERPECGLTEDILSSAQGGGGQVNEVPEAKVTDTKSALFMERELVDFCAHGGKIQNLRRARFTLLTSILMKMSSTARFNKPFP
jgi:hypothetical protein